MSAALPRFRCPRCHDLLKKADEETFRCPKDNAGYRLIDGIWHCLSPEDGTRLDEWLRRYTRVRRDEGWAVDDPVYYRSLPHEDTSGRHAELWRRRAQSYDKLLEKVVDEQRKFADRPLAILDLGAGNGWLSLRLSENHWPVAVDVSTDPHDGLATLGRYGEVPFHRIQASFEALPFADRQFDLAIYNDSLHYAVNGGAALREAWRVLRPGARLVVLDSPVYEDARGGERAIAARRKELRERYGWEGEPLKQLHYLSRSRLNSLAIEGKMTWRPIIPYRGLRQMMRPLVERVKNRRIPANYPILVGKRSNAEDRELL